MTMFRKRKAPDQPFAHAPDCKIVHADPGVRIPWNEIRRGVWEARCACGVQYHHDPSPTTVSGSTRSTRRPLATRGSASSTA